MSLLGWRKRASRCVCVAGAVLCSFFRQVSSLNSERCIAGALGGCVIVVSLLVREAASLLPYLLVWDGTKYL